MNESREDKLHLYSTPVYVRRSSVLLVCGTRLNTRRSPSVMRLLLVSTDWRWPGTAETPVMRCDRHRALTGTPTECCSVLQTATTTGILSSTAPFQWDAAGGLECALQTTSPVTTTAFGRRPVLCRTCKRVTCWWNSTNKSADHADESSVFT